LNLEKKGKWTSKPTVHVKLRKPTFMRDDYLTVMYVQQERHPTLHSL